MKGHYEIMTMVKYGEIFGPAYLFLHFQPKKPPIIPPLLYKSRIIIILIPKLWVTARSSSVEVEPPFERSQGFSMLRRASPRLRASGSPYIWEKSHPSGSEIPPWTVSWSYVHFLPVLRPDLAQAADHGRGRALRPGSQLGGGGGRRVIHRRI